MQVREKRAQGRFDKLVQRADICERGVEIRRCFALVCEESLRAGGVQSSLNADGTPVQIALSLVPRRPAAFEFVGEPFQFQSAMDYPARLAFGFECMSRVAEVIGVQEALDAVRPRLEGLADTAPAGDWEDPVGALWIGAAFDREGDSAMTVYENARRGSEDGRWKRLIGFVGGLGPGDWSPIFAVASVGRLKPLGAGLRLRKGRTPQARVYFGAYGVRPEEYRRMFRDAGAGAEFDQALDDFFTDVLGDECTHPTRSAVFSFGSDEDKWSPKFELCGHCAWRSDREAISRCGAWLERLHVDADFYRDVVEILTADREEFGTPAAHAYVGVGMKRDQTYASIYLNPGRDL
jgi:hypothetical protein